MATPIGLPYFITELPAGIVRSAILWPRGIASRTVSEAAPLSTVPGDSASSAVATLSASLMTMMAFTG